MDSRKSSLSNFETVSLETDDLTKLVCPVCFEYMKPPIMQCANGHGICEFCHDLLTECPICQGDLLHRRSSNLETLSTLVLYPCKKCGSKVSFSELTIHECEVEDEEVGCLFGQVYGDCTWRGGPDTMIEHCRLKHSQNYWTQFENCTRWCCSTLSNIGVQNIFIIDSLDAVFILVQKFDSDTNTLQWFISCESHLDKYSYEIAILSPDTEHTLVCRTNIKNEENIVTFLPSDNKIVLPVDKLHEFLTEDAKYLNYKVVIHKGSVQEVATEDSNKSAENAPCLKRTWDSVLSVYSTIKSRLFCSKNT